MQLRGLNDEFVICFELFREGIFWTLFSYSFEFVKLSRNFIKFDLKSIFLFSVLLGYLILQGGEGEGEEREGKGRR